MASIPLSQITFIASALGVFFLIVAFYKSIFHKRRHPTESELPATPKPNEAINADEPIKLTDPFQQVPVDALPRSHVNQQAHPVAPNTFYPTLQRPNESSVSAFRHFNPKKEFESITNASKNDTTYEWE